MTMRLIRLLLIVPVVLFTIIIDWFNIVTKPTLPLIRDAAFASLNEPEIWQKVIVFIAWCIPPFLLSFAPVLTVLLLLCFAFFTSDITLAEKLNLEKQKIQRNTSTRMGKISNTVIIALFVLVFLAGIQMITSGNTGNTTGVSAPANNPSQLIARPTRTR